jgi:hypothetical protein
MKEWAKMGDKRNGCWFLVRKPLGKQLLGRYTCAESNRLKKKHFIYILRTGLWFRQYRHVARMTAILKGFQTELTQC